MLSRTRKPLGLWTIASLTLSFIFVSLLTGFISFNSQAISAEAFANPAFQSVWNRTDSPQVVSGRSYLWGPEPFFNIQEPYEEAPGGQRLVQYFDKSRMEITNPNGDRTSPFFVTNGLLVNELMSGNMQVGDNRFMPRLPALIGVAGDPGDLNAPTYFSLGKVTSQPPAAVNSVVSATIDKNGNVSNDPTFGSKYNVRATTLVQETKHVIAEPFWAFLNQTGAVLDAQNRVVPQPLFSPTFYATGFPVTEAYWSQVLVAGQPRDVLVQAFERRVLTYTPANDKAFQVEMGNVGRHYYEWRYGSGGTSPSPSASAIAGLPGAPMALCAGQSAPDTTALSTNASIERMTNQADVQSLCIAANKSNTAVQGAQVAIKVTHKDTSQNYSASPTGKNGRTSFNLDITNFERNTNVIIDITVTYLGDKASTQLTIRL